jgi:excisionase family DNA binding protein
MGDGLLTRVRLNGVWVPVELDPAAPALIAALLPQNESGRSSPYMTLAEAADYLRWPKKRLYKLTAAGAIPHRKHEHRILFHVRELDLWLESFCEGPRVDPPRPSAYTSGASTNGPAPRQRSGPGTEGGTFDAFPA